MIHRPIFQMIVSKDSFGSFCIAYDTCRHSPLTCLTNSTGTHAPQACLTTGTGTGTHAHPGTRLPCSSALLAVQPTELREPHNNRMPYARTVPYVLQECSNMVPAGWKFEMQGYHGPRSLAPGPPNNLKVTPRCR